MFEAKIGGSTLYGVDIIELDDDDRISSFTVLARPMAGLTALGARMSAMEQKPKQSQVAFRAGRWLRTHLSWKVADRTPDAVLVLGRDVRGRNMP